MITILMDGMARRSRERERIKVLPRDSHMDNQDASRARRSKLCLAVQTTSLRLRLKLLPAVLAAYEIPCGWCQ